MGRQHREAMSPLELHVLVALAAGPLHGYALAEAVAAESGGTVTPRAGSLYRVIARLVTAGRVRESAPGDELPHPGLRRRYYELTAAGRKALEAEASRLAGTAAVARERLDIARSRS